MTLLNKGHLAIALCMALILSQGALLASPGGISGRTLKGSSPGCTCHASSPSTSVTLVINGPSTLAAGQTGTYSVQMTASSITGGGIDIAASGGSLATTDSKMKTLNSELVQKAKQSGTSPMSWTFSYTAPAAAGTQTLYATGCRSYSGWNHAPNFSVTVTAASSVVLSAPVGGENWTIGTVKNITWSSSGVTNVKIEYSTDNGTNWVAVSASTPAAAGTYAWTIPNTPSTQCKVRVSDAANSSLSSVSSAVFKISAPLPSILPISHLRLNDAAGVSQDTGLVVVVKGTVTVGNEFNSPSYIQDTTGGVAVYGRGTTAFSGMVKIGDVVQVEGKVINYNGLTEFNPVSTFTKIDSGKSVTPKTLTISQIISQAWNGLEAYEGMLIKLEGVSLLNPPAVWVGGTNYTMKQGSDTLAIRITANTTLVGQSVSAGPYNIIGALSQYKASAPYNTGYQLLPRFKEDVVLLTDVKDILGKSTSFSLNQNYPNPFNPSTRIEIELPVQSEISLQVYDLLGSRVREIYQGAISAGKHQFTFNAGNLPSGIYLCKLTVNNMTFSRKMLFLK